MTRAFTTMYGLVTMVAMFLGLIVAIIFTIALFFGHDQGNMLAVLAGNIMNIGIALAAIAMAAGLVVIYATRTHSLTMEKPPNNDHDTTDRTGE